MQDLGLLHKPGLQPHPPTWRLLFAAVSPIHRLGIILFRCRGVDVAAWGRRGLKALSIFIVTGLQAGNFLACLQMYSRCQLTDRSPSPPSTFHGCGTANEGPGLTPVNLKGRKGGEERESFAPHVTDASQAPEAGRVWYCASPWGKQQGRFSTATSSVILLEISPICRIEAEEVLACACGEPLCAVHGALGSWSLGKARDFPCISYAEGSRISLGPCFCCYRFPRAFQYTGPTTGFPRFS